LLLRVRRQSFSSQVFLGHFRIECKHGPPISPIVFLPDLALRGLRSLCVFKDTLYEQRGLSFASRAWVRFSLESSKCRHRILRRGRTVCPSISALGRRVLPLSSLSLLGPGRIPSWVRRAGQTASSARLWTGW